MVDDPTDPAVIADRICAYLAARPLAADTARGIAEWWLGDVSPVAVEVALLSLEAKGIVTADHNADRTAVWRASDAFRAAHAA